MRSPPRHEAPSTAPDGPTPSEVAQALRRAVHCTDRGGAGLVELGWYLHRVHGRPEEAERLLEEGAAKALATLEEAWAGLIQVLAEQGKRAQALELGEVARRTFPDSARLAEALAAARAGGR